MVWHGRWMVDRHLINRTAAYYSFALRNVKAKKMYLKCRVGCVCHVIFELTGSSRPKSQGILGCHYVISVRETR